MLLAVTNVTVLSLMDSVVSLQWSRQNIAPHPVHHNVSVALQQYHSAKKCQSGTEHQCQRRHNDRLTAFDPGQPG